MSTNSKIGGSEELQENLIFALSLAAMGGVAGGFLILKQVMLKDNFFTDKFTKDQKIFHIMKALVAVAISSVILYFYWQDYPWWTVGLAWLSYTYLCFSIGLFIMPKFMKDKLYKRITSKYVHTRHKDPSGLEPLLLDPSAAPVGYSLTTKKPVSIPANKRNEHVLITGSTGSRKSSAAITMRRWDFMNGVPVIDIDPKGDSEDIETIKEAAATAGRAADFLHFNLSDSENSWGYNPLLIGSKRSKVDKIIYALGLDHEHYIGIAEDVISLIFDVFAFLKEEVTVTKLGQLMIQKQILFEYFEKVLEKEESAIKSNLTMRISSFKTLKAEDLKGIRSKLSTLASFELEPLLNPDTEKQIDLNDVVENGRIAYFQLNTMEFKNLNRVISRFILSDLEIIASQLASGDIKSKSDFVAVYLDEALKIIGPDFPDYLRMVRSSNIGLTIIAQSVAKLDREYGKAYKYELLNEIKTTMHFEAAYDPDIEIFSLIGGTIKTRQRSFALETKNLFKYSGRGTESDMEEKLIDSNVLRKLRPGQCLFTDRNRKKYDILASWSGKTPGVTPRTRQQIENNEVVFEEKEKNEKPSRRFSEEELNFLSVRPSDWQSILTYSQTEKAIAAQKKWSRKRIFSE